MYNFEVIRAKVSPPLDSLPPEVVANVIIPTDEDMRKILRLFVLPHERVHSPVYIPALRERMIERAPLTKRQETAKRKGQNVNYRYILTLIGRRYLADLNRSVALVIEGHWWNNPAGKALEPVIESLVYQAHLDYQAHISRIHRQIVTSYKVVDLEPCPF